MVDTERLRSLGYAMKEDDCESMANLCCAAADELIALRNSLKCYRDTFNDDQIELRRLRSEQSHYSSQHRQLQNALGTSDSVVELAKKLVAERDAALARVSALENQLTGIAEIVQRIIPVGQVKAIGLLECFAGVKEIEQMWKDALARAEAAEGEAAKFVQFGTNGYQGQPIYIKKGE